MVQRVFITSSAGTLGARSRSYQPLFSPLPVHDTLFFDEGPRAPNAKTRVTSSLSGAIDTSAVDPYVQGVEITRQAQYDAGVVKIWSGNPGHILKPNRFGMDKNFFPDPGFADLDLFDPVRLLKAEAAASPLWFNILTYPIITGDNDQAENFNFNGVIEPLTIRAVVAFFSTEAPFEAHTVRGSFGNGNTNQLNGSDVVTTIYAFEPKQQVIGYLDMVDIIHGHPLNGFFRFEFTTLLPFDDVRLVRNTINESQIAGREVPQILGALSLMTGSTDNYVRHNQRSMPCGWYYDNNGGVGTDSLAFGGMTY
jgi:hypothetical protein